MTGKEKETFQFFKNIFNLHLQRKYPDVDKFNTGQHTKELSKIIPLTYLKELVRYYRLFAKIAERPRNPAREISKFSGDPMNVPKRDISDVEELLKKLRKKKWLREIDVAEINNSLLKKILKSPKGVERELQLTKGKFRGPGPWPNYALHFIVFFLVTYAREITGQPCFAKIADFLVQQDIGPGGFDAAGAMKTYQYTSDVWAFYDGLMQNFEREFFDGLFEYPDIPVHLREAFHKFCLPEMIEFHPCHPRWKEEIIPK